MASQYLAGSRDQGFANVGLALGPQARERRST